MYMSVKALWPSNIHLIFLNCRGEIPVLRKQGIRDSQSTKEHLHGHKGMRLEDENRLDVCVPPKFIR